MAEHFQAPVFVLSDLDIGMNDWLVPRLTWDDGYRPDRGKLLTAPELEAMVARYTRYWPEDDDGVAARTLPGVHAKGAYFARGSGHNKLGGYTTVDYQAQWRVGQFALIFKTTNLTDRKYSALGYSSSWNPGTYYPADPRGLSLAVKADLF